jgi:endonuclease/exonuclease/phosphatase family metal-dependent hydrolase
MATVEQDRSRFAVISWNVLHIIHEMNYELNRSPVLSRYSIAEKTSNETIRLNDIVDTLRQLIDEHATMELFVCLQEVPGDLLVMLESLVKSLSTGTALVHKSTYTRRPKLREQTNESIYVDPSESLVMIHYRPTNINGQESEDALTSISLSSTDQVSWIPCPDDAGKGALAITTADGLTVVNIHVPFAEQAAMSLLSNISWPTDDKRFVLTGDMNRYPTSLMNMIESIERNRDFFSLLRSVSTDKATRVCLTDDGTRRQSSIDYFVASTSLTNSISSSVVVRDHIGDVSDHYPVTLEF